MARRKVSRKERKATLKFVKKENKMPVLLIIAELFLIVMCVSYIFKITGLIMDIAEGPKFPGLLTLVLLEMDLIFLVTTVFAALSVSSRRSESWRKVVRSCFTFTFATILSTTLMTSTSHVHDFDFNPVVTGVLLMILVCIMLFSRSIKEFYTPPMTAVPSLKEWIIFIVYGKLFDTQYHIAFRGEKPSDRGKSGGPDIGIPDEMGPLANDIYDIPGHL